jgi:hypothetical protein
VRQSEGRVSAEVSSALEFNTCRGKGGSVLPYCCILLNTIVCDRVEIIDWCKFEHRFAAL